MLFCEVPTELCFKGSGFFYSRGKAFLLEVLLKFKYPLPQEEEKYIRKYIVVYKYSLHLLQKF